MVAGAQRTQQVKTQASTTLIRSQHVFRVGAAVLMALLPLTAASARVHHNDAWSRQQYANAERMREALNGRPSAERTRREYQRVIDAYRRVYFGAPTSSKADPSVVATAELMVEMGRQFDDNKILRGAIEQYRFLRKEYPGSKYRFDALFTIGEVYKDDLDDPEEARTTFEDFLHRYPRNRLADDAHSAVKEIDADAEEMERAEQEAARTQRSDPRDAQTANATRELRSKLPRVTGVRHWSTPDYTRIAIDVEQEVKFGSQRLANPDRIYFDLRDTKLASTLVGKTFDVDDGFLKKIRVAEFKPGRTRVVLEVDDLARYDAFLLPNPYRLIIDIHGKQKRATVIAKGVTAFLMAFNRSTGTLSLVRYPEALSLSTIRAYSSSVCMLKTITGREGRFSFTARNTSKPAIPGRPRSRITTSYLLARIFLQASGPSAASPTTSMSGAALITFFNPSRKIG